MSKEVENKNTPKEKIMSEVEIKNNASDVLSYYTTGYDLNYENRDIYKAALKACEDYESRLKKLKKENERLKVVMRQVESYLDMRSDMISKALNKT